MTGTGCGRFVILSTQRSGSNWLEDRLGSHPRVTMYREEVFRPTLRTPVAYRSYREARPGRRIAGRIVPPLVKGRYLRWLRDSATADAPVVGFRLMYDQLRRNPSVGPMLAASRTRFVHLVRENVLETYVSVAAARASGLYVTKSTVKKSPPVVIDPRSVLAELERRQRLIDRHRALLRAVPSIEISYEELVRDARAVDDRILEFLHLDRIDLGSALRRSGDRPLRERIENVREVEAALRSTAFAALLD